MTAKIKKKTLILSGLVAIGVISILQGAFNFFSSSRSSILSQNQLRDLLVINKAQADVPNGVGGILDGVGDPNGGTGACPSGGGPGGSK